MNGISLLEHHSGKPLWTTVPQKLGKRNEIMRVGPAGPSFCSFQARQHLVVVDPASGQTLWQRTDLDAQSGLLSDPYAGLFGDKQVLVLFSSDRSTYTVFRTATGEELHHGKFDVDPNQQRKVFGRKLFYLSNSATGKRIRIWDPLEDRVVFDMPLAGKIYVAVTRDGELVMAMPPDRLRILDVASGEVRLDLKLSESDLTNLNGLRAFRDHQRYYLNFQRTVQLPASRKYSYYASDTFLPTERVQGDLLCVERSTGKPLWKRAFPQRSVIQMPHLRLPFLITMSRVRDRWHGNKQSLLVEVVDAATGRTIGLKDNIFPDRVLQFSYDPEMARIELVGQRTLVGIDFGAARQRLPLAIERLMELSFAP